METPIIEVKNIGKRYTIDHERGRYIALRDVFASIIRRPFAFMKTKAKRAVGLDKKEEFWALRNVNFSVQKGEVIGIIGRNGAGKSTLLKILSQITPPTEGEITLRGRVGSLLEVGTGFHPELTGRENIFLNGAILGMKRSEIARKFDDIVNFAGVGKFIDTPVKRYSSGMYVRLAFSVAAHMEPDILIVDEVLAVGDAEFQKKCLGKMEEVTRKEGRTILFVSHNMAAVDMLCKKTVWLENGTVRRIGETKDIVAAYLTDRPSAQLASARRPEQIAIKKEKGVPHFTDITVGPVGGGPIKSDSRLEIKLGYSSGSSKPITEPQVSIIIFNEASQQRTLYMNSGISEQNLGETLPPEGTITCETGEIDLKAGSYTMTVWLTSGNTNHDVIDDAFRFEVTTDMEKFNYRLPPTKDFTDHLIPYAFKKH